MEDVLRGSSYPDCDCDLRNCTVDDMDVILGYTLREDGVWEAIIQPRGYIYTCAFILCTSCRKPISGYGGPRYNSYCLECFNEMSGMPSGS